MQRVRAGHRARTSPGGGGLLATVARNIAVGAGGSVLANGGNGATGENTIFNDHIGGSSGGGSGGMIVLYARRVDPSEASDDALQARGGIGGAGSKAAQWSKGGGGGPGLIQIHVEDARTDLLQPSGGSLEDVSLPDAHVLLPWTRRSPSGIQRCRRGPRGARRQLSIRTRSPPRGARPGADRRKREGCRVAGAATVRSPMGARARDDPMRWADAAPWPGKSPGTTPRSIEPAP